MCFYQFLKYFMWLSCSKLKVFILIPLDQDCNQLKQFGMRLGNIFTDYRRGWLKTETDTWYNNNGTSYVGAPVRTHNYDYGGRRTSLSTSSPIETINLTHDNDDQLIQLTSSNGACENRQYDANGNLSTRTDCSGVNLETFRWSWFNWLDAYYSPTSTSSSYYRYDFFPDSGLNTRGYQYQDATATDLNNVYISKGGDQFSGQILWTDPERFRQRADKSCLRPGRERGNQQHPADLRYVRRQDVLRCNSGRRVHRDHYPVLQCRRWWCWAGSQKHDQTERLRHGHCA